MKQEEIFFCLTCKIVQDTNNFIKARVTDFIVYSVTDIQQILV